MAAPERELIDERLAFLKPHERRFRINSGCGWTASRKDTRVVKQADGGRTVVLRNARPFHGAPKGWPDLFGWDSVSVTREMVGEVLAVAAAEEVKASGSLSLWQRLFRDCLLRMGGRYGVIRADRLGPRRAPVSRAKGSGD